MLTKLPWLGPLIVFGLVVFVHELGHFIAAKAFGVYAPRFSIGFGPALLRKRWGETEYVIAALPLGGYVRMASRDDEATAFIEGGTEEGAKRSAQDPRYDPDAMIPFGPKPVPPDRWFESKPLWQRLVIMVAGVTMNIALALLVFTLIPRFEGRRIIETRVIGSIDSVSWAPMLAASLAPGDTINAVAGSLVSTWNEIEERILGSPDARVAITTNRGEVALDAGPPRGPRRRDLALALEPWRPAVIGTVISGAPASRAGLMKGDSLVAVAGTPVRTWTDMTAIVTAAPGRPLDFLVSRKGTTSTITIKPDSSPEKDPATGRTTFLGRIGVTTPDIARREPIGLRQAASYGWRATWGSTGLVIGFVRDLFMGRVSFSQVGGPIAITRASVDAARDGSTSLFALLAFLSVNLAVMNLLPIPILDGGQIVMNIAESVKGAPFTMRTREYILRAGLLAIALLFVVVMFNDLRRLTGVARDFLTRVL